MAHAEVVELSAADAGRLRKRYPALVDRRRLLLVGLDDDPVAETMAAIENATTIAVGKPDSWEQARRNLVMRQRILAEFGALSAAELGEWATPEAANPHQYASRLKKLGKAFAVPFQGRQMFLGFQFDAEGRPLPGMREILTALRQRFRESDWSVASWFTSPNAYLPQRARPVDLLGGDPGLLIEAARRGVRRGVG